mgnify:CR=1 FL=1|tara:strand:+ start:26 stop:319 length:294 start_codon:yes stop_codon:yes gene_type:complete
MNKPSEIQIAYSKLMESMEGMAKDAKGWKVSDISAVTGMTSAIRSLKSENSIAQARIVELGGLVKEADDYLDINSMTNIGSGSVLHTKFKQALEGKS